jgi:transcriptional regulator with XRE-family HTH domain
VKLPGLRMWRELRGYTQVKLAEEAQTTQDTISKLETEARGARPSTVKKLAEKLQVDPMLLADPAWRVDETYPLVAESPTDALDDLKQFVLYARVQVAQAERGELTGRNLRRLREDILGFITSAQRKVDEALDNGTSEVAHMFLEQARILLGLAERMQDVHKAELEEWERETYKIKTLLAKAA